MSWAQLGEDLTFYCQFKASKVGKTGLSPTVDIWEDTAAGTLTQIVTGGSATEIGRGFYKYRLTGANVDAEGCYICCFITADATVDDQQIGSLWIAGKAGVENIDATISSRNATTPPTAAAIADEVRVELATELARVDVAISTRNGTTPPTVGAIADAVWDEPLSGHTTAGTAGKAVADAGGAADPLTNEVPGAYTAPQAGYYLGRLANNQVNIVSNFDPDTMELSYYYGDDYVNADNRAQTFTTTYTLTGGSVALEVRNATALVSIPCTIVDAHTYRLDLTAENLATITVGVWQYHLRMSLPTSTDKITEVYGTLLVSPDVR